MFTTDGNRDLFPVAAETLLGRNYSCCHPHWPSTNCCFFIASDIWQHDSWDFLPCFCKPVHAVSASLQTCPAPSSQPPEKGRSQPARFSGNILNKTATVTMLSAPILHCEASSSALKVRALCRSQKGVAQLQQDPLELSSQDAHMHTRMMTLKMLSDLLQQLLVFLLLSLYCFNQIY